MTKHVSGQPTAEASLFRMSLAALGAAVLLVVGGILVSTRWWWE